MKNSIKWIVTACLLAGIIGGATLLYNRLGEDYKENEFAEETETVQEKETDSSFAAPDFTALDLAGKEVKLSDYKGKPVVLNFWATWCQYCTEEMPDFQKAFEAYPDVQFLMINATDGVRETKAKAEAYLKEEGFTFPVLFDTKEEAVYNYYVTGFPCTYFIDAEGNLVTYASGMLSYDNLIRGIELIAQ